jgi:LRR receptor-like serine/threonine-protein kinase FLS2
VACLAANKQNITTDEFALLAFKSLITLEPYDMLANNWSTSSSICNWIGVTCDELHNRVHTLNLSNMGLRGTISPNLGNMSFLVILDLSHNIFSSFIPQSIGNLHQLKILDMRDNRLSGPIPQTFSNLSSLEEISLSHNYLSGAPSLGNMSSLVILDLSHNNIFNSFIPQSIGNLPQLKILDMRYNRLSGPIPQIFSNLFSLEEISLSHNYFSGTSSSYIMRHICKKKLMLVMFICLLLIAILKFRYI